jgi:mannose-6-phosphate isomerase-like protein (cupin superfamily)
MSARAPLTHSEAWLALSLALPDRSPPAALLDRVLGAADRSAPYRTYLPRLAALFDLDERAVHDLLVRMDDPKCWTPGIGATLAFMHFDAGPRLAVAGGAAHCGLARMRSGAKVPHHRHKGRELTFVLRGAVVEDGGARCAAGQVLDVPAGSEHSLRVEGEPDALVAVMLSEIEIVRPPSPPVGSDPARQ